MSSQRRFLSFPVIGAMGIVGVVGGQAVEVGSRRGFRLPLSELSPSDQKYQDPESSLSSYLLSSIVYKCSGNQTTGRHLLRT
jgi:hypothetical protein